MHCNVGGRRKSEMKKEGMKKKRGTEILSGKGRGKKEEMREKGMKGGIKEEEERENGGKERGR